MKKSVATAKIPTQDCLYIPCSGPIPSKATTASTRNWLMLAILILLYSISNHIANPKWKDGLVYTFPNPIQTI